jgi:hypothetical protein
MKQYKSEKQLMGEKDEELSTLRKTIKKLYTEEEVSELLETQRGNCYVAILSKTYNDMIATEVLTAPEPGGKNGTWKKQ